MYNYTTDCYQLKRLMRKYLKNFSNNALYSRVFEKGLHDLVYGIAASKSLRLTSIARTLNESIKLESIITRMDRLINDDDFKVDLFTLAYVSMVKSIVDVNNMIVMVDDTDINKKYSKKLEDLDRVRDGSSTKKSEYNNGYHVTEMVAISSKSSQPITIASKIYSSKSIGFISKNSELDNLLKEVVRLYGDKITFVFDRGFDDKKLIKLLEDLNVKYIIRINDRRVVYYQNKKRSSLQLKTMCKGKIAVDFKSKTVGETIKLKMSHLKVSLNNMRESNCNVIVVHGFGKNAMCLINNIKIESKQDVQRCFWNYIKRWKIEELFRYMKSEFGYEDMRVRRIAAMQKLVNTLHLVNTILVKIYETGSKTLVTKILERSKSLRRDVTFYLYQLANGIFEILKTSRKSLRGLIRKEHRKRDKMK